MAILLRKNLLAPFKGVPLVQRLYHDIFDDEDAALCYANDLKLHASGYPTSIVTFLVYNKGNVAQQEWYQQQKEAMQLMEEKKQTYLDDSFRIFVKSHIENLKKLECRKEAA